MRTGVILFVLAAVCQVFAGTLYVDPVSGSDVWDGTSPLYISGDIGPKETILAAATTASVNDVIILLDGTYEGDDNGSPAVFDMLDINHIQLTSQNGSGDCTIVVSPQIEFSHSPSPSGVLPTLIKSVTFTAPPISKDMNSYNDTIFTVLNDAELQFKNCIFTGFNVIPDYDDLVDSTVLVVKGESQVQLDECVFNFNNMACLIWTGNSAFLDINRCSFENNYFSRKSGTIPGLKLIYQGFYSTLKVADSDFINNYSNLMITGIWCESSNSLDVKGCLFDNNTSSYDRMTSMYHSGAIYCGGTGSKRILNTTLSRTVHTDTGTNQTYGQGIEVFNYGGPERHVKIDGCSITENPTGIRYSTGSNTCEDTIEISNCSLFNNETGVNLSTDTNGFGNRLIIKECDIYDNRGGVYISAAGDASLMAKGACLKNCLITDNNEFGIRQSDMHSLFWQPKLSVENCTITNNGGIGLRVPEINIKNTIVYGNNNSGPQIETISATTLDYCDIEGGWSGSGVGNIDLDPDFVDAAGRDYHLISQAGRWDIASEDWLQDTSNSPCIDAGDPADYIMDEPYGSGGRINIGAYGGTQYASKTTVCTGGLDGKGKMPGDINHDCQVDLMDFKWIAIDWLNRTTE